MTFITHKSIIGLKSNNLGALWKEKQPLNVLIMHFKDSISKPKMKECHPGMVPSFCVCGKPHLLAMRQGSEIIYKKISMRTIVMVMVHP